MMPLLLTRKAVRATTESWMQVQQISDQEKLMRQQQVVQTLATEGGSVGLVCRGIVLCVCV